ncbi:hypothetical protein LGM69_25275 [Burkholderia multivorans]|nr:hypothetical protein [Burkholderia multivorans]
MNKKHPAYLVRQANGMFAFQIYIPAPLRAQGTPASICRSLRTKRSPRRAGTVPFAC